MGFQLLRRHPLPVTFFLLALLILGTRWHTRLEPLDRDISAYAVIGREMLNGRPLYSDLWDHKPPGIHLIFAGATVASSPGTPAVLLVNLVCSIAALAGFMVAGRRLAGTADHDRLEGGRVRRDPIDPFGRELTFNVGIHSARQPAGSGVI